MARTRVANRSDIVNTSEKNLSSVKISTFGDVFLCQKVSRFIVSQVNPNKGIDLVGRVKPPNNSWLTINTARMVLPLCLE